MGKIALSQNLSLDGVMQLDGEMQSPGPSDVPFKYPGWAMDCDGGPEGARFNYGHEVGLEQAQNSEALLLGRITYEAMRPSGRQRKVSSPKGWTSCRSTSFPRRSRTRPRTRPSWATTGGRKWPDCERSSTPRCCLWQPPPLAGTDRDAAGGRAAPTGLAGSARCRRSPVRGDAGEDHRCAWRIASARGPAC